MTNREPSRRADARAPDLNAAATAAELPADRSSADHPPADTASAHIPSGNPGAASPAGMGPRPQGGVKWVPDQALLERMRMLYETWTMPVSEIARCAGIAERTLYRYVRKGHWRRRHPYPGRGEREAAPETCARLNAAMAQFSADAQASAARASAEIEEEQRLQRFETLCGTLVELVSQRAERPEGKIPIADELDARLQDLILTAMWREIRQQ